jgi:hypothetical protein
MSARAPVAAVCDRRVLGPLQSHAEKPGNINYAGIRGNIREYPVDGRFPNRLIPANVRRDTAPEGRPTIAHGFSRGNQRPTGTSPVRGGRNVRQLVPLSRQLVSPKPGEGGGSGPAIRFLLSFSAWRKKFIRSQAVPGGPKRSQAVRLERGALLRIGKKPGCSVTSVYLGLARFTSVKARFPPS